MRIITLLSCLAVLWAVSMPAQADGMPGEAPVPVLAAHALEATGPTNDALVERVAEMDEAQLRRFLDAMRTRHHAGIRLASKRVANVRLDEARLDDAIAVLRTATGTEFVVSEKVREEKDEDIRISLDIKDVSAKTMLDLITEQFAMVWVARGAVIEIRTQEEDDPEGAPADPDASDLRKSVEATKVSLSVEAMSFKDVVATLQIQTGMNILIDSRIASDVEQCPVARLQLVDAALDTALNMLAATAGEGVIWITRGNVVLFTMEELR